MSTEPKDGRKKKIESFLPDEIRIDLIGKLEGLGIDVKDMSDSEMLKKIGDVAEEEREMRAEESARKTISSSKHYLQRALDVKIKDSEFALRLYNLGVPHIFLEAFDDDDKKLDDEAIWKKVSDSGILQFRERKDIFARRSVRPFKTVSHPYRVNSYGV